MKTFKEILEEVSYQKGYPNFLNALEMYRAKVIVHTVIDKATGSKSKGIIKVNL